MRPRGRNQRRLETAVLNQVGDPGLRGKNGEAGNGIVVGVADHPADLQAAGRGHGRHHAQIDAGGAGFDIPGHAGERGQDKIGEGRLGRRSKGDDRDRVAQRGGVTIEKIRLQGAIQADIGGENQLAGQIGRADAEGQGRAGLRVSD